MSRSRSDFARAFAAFCACFSLTCVTLLGHFLAGPCPRARAHEEQLGLDLALGYGWVSYSETLSADPPSPATALPSHLANVDLGVSMGVSDWLMLRGLLGYGLMLEKDTNTRQFGRVRVEAAYLVDIVQWVPFLGLGTGLWLLEDPGGGVLPRGDAYVVFGLEYLATRAWTVGLDLRTGFLMGGGPIFSATEGQLRLSRMFELF